jgi:WD40 repeat protein
VQTRKQHGQPLEASLDRIHIVRFSPDGKQLAFLAGVPIKAFIWDLATRQLVGNLSEVVKPCDLVFSPDGKLLAVSTCPTSPSSGDELGVVYLFDTTTYQQIDGSPLTGHPSGIFCLAFSPDSRTIASGDMDGNVYLWDLP